MSTGRVAKTFWCPNELACHPGPSSPPTKCQTWRGSIGKISRESCTLSRTHKSRSCICQAKIPKDLASHNGLHLVVGSLAEAVLSTLSMQSLLCLISSKPSSLSTSIKCYRENRWGSCSAWCCKESGRPSKNKSLLPTTKCQGLPDWLSTSQWKS